MINHGLFPVFLLAAVIAPLALLIHPLAKVIEHKLGWWYMLVMPVLVVLWCIIPALLYRRLVRDAADRILRVSGVVLCPGCDTDLRRFAWETTLDPVCPSCGERFDRDRLALLLDAREL